MYKFTSDNFDHGNKHFLINLVVSQGSSLIWVHIVCTIGNQSYLKQMTEQKTVGMNGGKSLTCQKKITHKNMMLKI